MADEKLGVATEPSPENLDVWSFVSEGLSPLPLWQRNCVAKLQLAL